MLGSECDFKMYVRNLGYTLSLKIGGLKPLFSMTSQLHGNLTAFWTEHDIHNRASALETKMGLLRRLKISYIDFGPQTA